MVLQLFIGLIILALTTLLITQGRRRRIWSVLLLTGLSVISYLFIDNLNQNIGSNFIYQWLPYSVLKADFAISSTVGIQQMFVPLIVLLGCTIYFNTIFPLEYHSLHLNTLLLLNFVALILLLSSHDFLQLMFASCIFSLISFYQPDLILSKKSMMVFNFLAEMSLFMALALVYGKTNTVSINDLKQFITQGEHKDLVVFLLLLAVGCKCGFCLLNGHYFNLKNISLNRLLGIMIFSTPLSGLIILSKLRPLFDASHLFDNIIPFWCLLSIALSFCISLCNNNLRLKLISLLLSIYSCAALIIYDTPTKLYETIPTILLSLLLVFVVFSLIDSSNFSETTIFQAKRLWVCSKINFMLSILIVLGLCSEFLYYPTNLVSKTFIFIFIALMSVIIKMIYLGKINIRTEQVSCKNNVGFLYWGPTLIGCTALFYFENPWHNKYFYLLFAEFLMLLWVAPYQIFIKIGNYSWWQSDILTKIYETILVYPLRLLGRVLWLAFDVVVIERSVIGSISTLTSSVVNELHKFQEPKLINFILGLMLGGILLSAYLGAYIHE